MRNTLVRYALILCFCMPGLAYGQGIGVGVKGGSTGLGVDFVSSIGSSLNIRLGGSFFPYTKDGIYEDKDVDIRYKAEANIETYSAILDWYPTSSGFHLSGGVYYNGTKVDGSAVPNEPYTYGKRTFTPEELGTLTGEAKYKSNFAPYVGMGFGNPVKTGKTVGAFVRIGAMYTDSPDFRMNGTGMIEPTAAQDKNIEDGLRDFKWYPVVNLGLSIKLF